MPRHAASATANRFAYVDGQGEIGFISSVSEPFCGACTRARLTADGTLYTCLFASRGLALRPLLRGAEDDEAIAAAIDRAWRRRDDRYSEQRSADAPETERVEMYRVGG
jgi:cyclic pyranopterin phosphate synthase